MYFKGKQKLYFVAIIVTGTESLLGVQRHFQQKYVISSRQYGYVSIRDV